MKVRFRVKEWLYEHRWGLHSRRLILSLTVNIEPLNPELNFGTPKPETLYPSTVYVPLNPKSLNP